jgi:hypothetical protein
VNSIDVLLDNTDDGAVTLAIASGEDMSVLDLANLVLRVTRKERGY